MTDNSELAQSLLIASAGVLLGGAVAALATKQNDEPQKTQQELTKSVHFGQDDPIPDEKKPFQKKVRSKVNLLDMAEENPNSQLIKRVSSKDNMLDGGKGGKPGLKRIQSSTKSLTAMKNNQYERLNKRQNQ